MKRYWKLAVLGSLIILSIGIFYGWVSGSGYPEYVLTIQKGDEKEVSPFIVQGNYRNEMLTIDSEGSHYLNERYLWQRYNGNHFGNRQLEKLVKEHPNFMRGKMNTNAIYEDDQVLAYGDIKPKFMTGGGQSDLRFDVSVYDKLQKDTSSFGVEVPKRDLYKFVYLYDVRVDGQTMKLFTFNIERKPEQEAKQEAHLYTLDLNKKNVVDDQVIISAVPPDENYQVHLNGVFPAKKSSYLVYEIIQRKKEPGAKPAGTNVSEAYKLEKTELFVYDIKSGKLEAIQNEEINGLLQETVNLTINKTDEDLFLISQGGQKESKSIKYNLVEKKVKNNLTIALNDYIAGPVSYSFGTVNNRLYMVANSRNENQTPTPTIVIADLDNGGVVYEGTISRKDGQELGNLRAENLTLKQ